MLTSTERTSVRCCSHSSIGTTRSSWKAATSTSRSHLSTKSRKAKTSAMHSTTPRKLQSSRSGVLRIKTRKKQKRIFLSPKATRSPQVSRKKKQVFRKRKLLVQISSATKVDRKSV